MKKTITLICALALSTVASAATSVILGYQDKNNSNEPDQAITDGADLFGYSQWGYARYLYPNGNERLHLAEQTKNFAPTAEKIALTTPGNTNYDLMLNAAFGDYNFSVNEAVYANSFTLVDVYNQNLHNLTINFGDSGSITTQNQFNIGQGIHGYKGENKFQISVIGTTTASINRTLITCKEFWNVKNVYDVGKLSLLAEGMDGFANVGVVTSAEAIGEYEYGLVLTTSSLTFVSKVPEPATATLSLLALVGMAARRRRA
ncbi:MAG: PEP-CTERM sorting domain-containing protein [Akkermansia sp.]